MSEMSERVAKALEQSFKDTIAKTSGMAFEQTGVQLPSPEVWNRYARVAVAAAREILLAARPLEDDE